MKTMHSPPDPPHGLGSRTLQSMDDGSVTTLDQARLPFEEVPLSLRTLDDCARAIVTMQVRGAPLIGATGAFGLAFGLREDAVDAALQQGVERLAATRPTAVNLGWALERVRARVLPLPPAQRADAAWLEACAIADEDARINRSIGGWGAPLLRSLARSGRPLQVLTHCNAGRLATVEHGTALSPLYALHADGVPVHVWVGETRPRNQGASLTAWELARHGVPCTVVADNAGGLLMRQGRVDAVIVGCDRVARNGDVANKVGTYLKALAAFDCGVPFYVACPTPTLDMTLADGDAIPIESRSAREVTHATGRDAAGRRVEVQLVPDGVAAENPAFDVTPARLVTAIVTEHGVCEASERGLRGLLAAAGSVAVTGAAATAAATAAVTAAATGAATRAATGAGDAETGVPGEPLPDGAAATQRPSA
jgi:methylthioribose-1-phosphate isomerase